MKNILLVEDDPNIAKNLLFIFGKNDLSVDHTISVTHSKELLESEEYELFLFDIGLSDGSGIELTRFIRSQNIDKPIILITARMDEDTLINGFEAGANDYLRKPFSNIELLARIRANLKRAKKTETQASFKSLRVDLTSRSCHYKEKEIKLNRRLIDILYYILKNDEKVISRDSLLNFLDIESTAFDRTIDSHISQLRKKLEQSGVDDIKITSIYGVGYKIEG